MRLLGIDGGAERMGWGSVERESGILHYHMSGLIEIPQGNTKFQDYRLHLEATLTHWFPTLLELTQPDGVVNEIVPAVGTFGGVQMYVVNVAVSVLHTVALQYGLPIYQIGATTVQSRLMGKRQKGRKVTKVQVRNKVIEIFPELVDRKRDWVKKFDEPDSIAVAVAELGYENGS